MTFSLSFCLSLSHTHTHSFTQRHHLKVTSTPWPAVGESLHAPPFGGDESALTLSAPCWQMHCWESTSWAHAHRDKVWSLPCHPEYCTLQHHLTQQSTTARAWISGSCLFQAVLFFVSKVTLESGLTEAMRTYLRKRYLGSAIIYF